jgi:glycosyltransferase involved in cell wall biosynthesis
LVSQKGNFLAVHGRGWSPRFARRLEELARGVDVVHDHGLWMWPNKYARKAARKAGKSLVISPRGMLEDWSLRRAVVRKFVAWQLFERKNLESAALFHATADSEAEAIKTALRIKMKIKIKEPRIVVAPNGVDIPERIPNREALEARFAKLRGRRWILFMSRVHPKKGLLELAKAWMQIRESNPGWELVIAGPEQDKGYAEKVKKEGGRKVVWTGELRGEEKWAALGHAEFLVLPSHSENFGIVVAESLAAGRPVVTSNKTPWGAARSEIKMKIKMKGPSVAPSPLRGGAMEGGCAGGTMNLEERKCGVICEVTDLKRGLERMLEFSDKERKEMGARGRQWMREEFSWEAGAEKLTSAYREILS